MADYLLNQLFFNKFYELCDFHDEWFNLTVERSFSVYFISEKQ
jgi:hypothetical protein